MDQKNAIRKNFHEYHCRSFFRYRRFKGQRLTNLISFKPLQNSGRLTTRDILDLKDDSESW